MRKQVYEINENGFLKEIYIEDESTTKFIILDPPQGLYKAKWTGQEWIEGMTQAEIDKLKEPAPEQEIINLKAELEETDYKVIKCYEYQLAGLEMPYDITELHTNRQVIRDKINELMEVQNE